MFQQLTFVLDIYGNGLFVRIWFRRFNHRQTTFNDIIFILFGRDWESYVHWQEHLIEFFNVFILIHDWTFVDEHVFLRFTMSKFRGLDPLHFFDVRRIVKINALIKTCYRSHSLSAVLEFILTTPLLFSFLILIMTLLRHWFITSQN